MKYIGTIKLTTTNDNDNLLLKVREKEHEIRPDFRLDDLGTSFIIRELEIKANIECDIIIDENKVILEAGEAISFKQPIRKLRCLKSGVDLIVNYAYGDLSSFDDDDCSHTCEPGAGGEGADLTDYYKKTETYNRVEVDTKIANVAGGGSVDLGNYYTKAEVDSKDNLKVDKVGGKSLVSDTEIIRLANVTNYDDTEVKSSLETIDHELPLKAEWGELSEVGRKIKIVACVIQNNGGTWQFIENVNHGKLNCTDITATTTGITINYGFTAKKILSFVACPDEVYATLGYTMGATVGDSSATIKISRNAVNIACYLYYDETTSSYKVTSTRGDFVVTSSASGIITLTHEDVGTSNNASCVGRDGVNACLGSIGRTTTQVKFYNPDGTLITTPTVNCKAYITRTSPYTTANPLLLNEASSNIWCFGVFEIN